MDGFGPAALLCGGRRVEGSEDLKSKIVQVLSYFGYVFPKLQLSAYLLEGFVVPAFHLY